MSRKGLNPPYSIIHAVQSPGTCGIPNVYKTWPDAQGCLTGVHGSESSTHDQFCTVVESRMKEAARGPCNSVITVQLTRVDQW